MATVYVTIGPAVTRDILDGAECRSETVTTSGTAASGALTANLNDVAMVFSDTAHYARSGGTVTAATGIFCPANIPQYFRMTEGTTISLITA